MFIVGLTGGIATGKSTVLSIFKDNGIAVIDADIIARKVLEPQTKGWKELKQYFGNEVLLPDGNVNRARLAELIFDDSEKRKKLNAITHPKIQRMMVKLALGYFLSGHTYVVMEVPLLFETGKLVSYMHKIITVVCEDHQQLERLCYRNDISATMAQQRISKQLPLEYKVSKSNYVIYNTGDQNSLRQQTENVIRTLKRSRFSWYFRAITLVLFICFVSVVVHIFRKIFNKDE